MYYGKRFRKETKCLDNTRWMYVNRSNSGKEKEFLAVQEFYLKITPSLAKIVWGKYEDGEWKFKDVVSIPYVHRLVFFMRTELII